MEDKHPKRLHLDCPLFLVLSIHQIRLGGIVPRHQYVSISNVQLPHSIVVSMMYSLTNQSTTPVVAQVEVVERGDWT